MKYILLLLLPFMLTCPRFLKVSRATDSVSTAPDTVQSIVENRDTVVPVVYEQQPVVPDVIPAKVVSPQRVKHHIRRIKKVKIVSTVEPANTIVPPKVDTIIETTVDTISTLETIKADSIVIQKKPFNFFLLGVLLYLIAVIVTCTLLIYHYFPKKKKKPKRLIVRTQQVDEHEKIERINRQNYFDPQHYENETVIIESDGRDEHR